MTGVPPVTFRAPAGLADEVPDTRPLWLLDVDGVLNAVTSSPDPAVWPDWRQGTARASGEDWPIRFSPTVAATVRRLHESGLAEVRWLTTWGAEANDALRALLDLPAFAVVAPGVAPAVPAATRDEASAFHGATAAGRSGEWWKLSAVRDLLARERRPLIWTDDDLRHEQDAVAWARSQVPRPLLVAPAGATGLTPGHLREIEEFCALHAGAP